MASMRAHALWSCLVGLAILGCGGGGAGGGAGAAGAASGGSSGFGNGGSGGSAFGGSSGFGAGAGSGSSPGAGGSNDGGNCYWPVTMNFNVHAPEVEMYVDPSLDYYVCLGAYATSPSGSWKSKGVRSYLFADSVSTGPTVGMQLAEAMEIEADPGFSPEGWNWLVGTYLIDCPDGKPNDFDASFMVGDNAEGWFLIECNQLPFVIDVPLTLVP